VAVPTVPWYRRLGHAFSRYLVRRLFGREITAELLADRDRLNNELSRRLAELHSLQELAHVLSASMRFDAVVTEVARYAMRALDASGAVVMLAHESGGGFDVVAAKGVLAGHLHRRIDSESGGLVLEAIAHERLEHRAAPQAGGLLLFPSASVRSAVVAPLRAHGVTVGAIAVVDRLVGEFGEDDARMLSTAATHAAVVLANARFFELVRVGKEQWEATFDALAEGIALISPDGTIRRANLAMARLIGTTISRIIGIQLPDALFGDARALDSLLKKARADNRPAAAVLRSERLGRTTRVSASPLAKPTADVATVIVVEDITEQKALETQLMQSEKLASVGTLVSGVAHELNNPLTSIAGLSEFLLEQGVGDQSQREHLRVINDQAERASGIVRNLLSFARSAPAERAPLDLGDVVRRTVMLISYELRRAGAEVETEVAEGLPLVLGNRDQLQQVLLNLLGNAAYAVASLPAGRPRRISVRARAADERVTVTVKDSGPGIPRETAARIFDPFFTTKPPGEGTGLGLFLSFGIAESHGGTLTVSSEPGAGASFTLSLPSADAGTPADTARQPARIIPPPPARRRILVVDDDPVMRRLVTVLFNHDGHDVDAAQSGGEGLELARQHGYDLIVADRRAAAGAETFATALVRERPGWRSRIIVSAADRPSLPGIEESTGLRLLKKPFNLRDLRSAAAEVWAENR